MLHPGDGYNLKMVSNMREDIYIDVPKGPFPHIIINNFYNEEELKLIWQELDFFTAPDKLLEPKDYGGVIDATNAKAIILDEVYGNFYRRISNILTTNRKLFTSGVLDVLEDVHPSCRCATLVEKDLTKLRYYHNGDYYEPHTDHTVAFLAFSYFYKEPKKFQGGELEFPEYDYELECVNNSTIIFPGWVEHGVKEVSIEESDYYEGMGRYCVSNFMYYEERKLDKNDKDE